MILIQIQMYFAWENNNQYTWILQSVQGKINLRANFQLIFEGGAKGRGGDKKSKSRTTQTHRFIHIKHTKSKRKGIKQAPNIFPMPSSILSMLVVVYFAYFPSVALFALFVLIFLSAVDTRLLQSCLPMKKWIAG